MLIGNHLSIRKDQFFISWIKADKLISFLKGRLSFEKIKTQLSFSTWRTVRDGIVEIAKLVQEGIIDNPQDANYGN